MGRPLDLSAYLSLDDPCPAQGRLGSQRDNRIDLRSWTVTLKSVRLTGKAGYVTISGDPGNTTVRFLSKAPWAKDLAAGDTGVAEFQMVRATRDGHRDRIFLKSWNGVACPLSAASGRQPNGSGDHGRARAEMHILATLAKKAVCPEFNDNSTPEPSGVKAPDNSVAKTDFDTSFRIARHLWYRGKGTLMASPQILASLVLDAMAHTTAVHGRPAPDNPAEVELIKSFAESDLEAMIRLVNGLVNRGKEMLDGSCKFLAPLALEAWAHAVALLGRFGPENLAGVTETRAYAVHDFDSMIRFLNRAEGRLADDTKSLSSIAMGARVHAISCKVFWEHRRLFSEIDSFSERDFNAMMELVKRANGKAVPCQEILAALALDARAHAISFCQRSEDLHMAKEIAINGFAERDFDAMLRLMSDGARDLKAAQKVLASLVRVARSNAITLHCCLEQKLQAGEASVNALAEHELGKMIRLISSVKPKAVACSQTLATIAAQARADTHAMRWPSARQPTLPEIDAAAERIFKCVCGLLKDASTDLKE